MRQHSEAIHCEVINMQIRQCCQAELKAIWRKEAPAGDKIRFCFIFSRRDIS